MSPTCSNKFFVGRKTLSAAALTKLSPPRGPDRPVGRRSLRHRNHHRKGVCAPTQPPLGGLSPWYVPPALRREGAALLALGATLLLASCGSGKRQDEDEPAGRYQIEVVEATFPKQQKLAKRSHLIIRVRNAGQKTVPNIAVTVNGFSERLKDPDLSDPNRPVFVINGVPKRVGDYPEAKEDSPPGCETAYVGTWACGPLKPGREKEFRWGVTASRAGEFKISWRVSAGLDGKAKALDAEGNKPVGVFAGTISDAPPATRVADDGETVIRGTR